MRTITKKHIFKTIGKVGIFLAVTALLLLVGITAMLFIIAHGPSADASNRLAATLSENAPTLAHIFFSDAELDTACYYAAPRDADAGIDGTETEYSAPTLTHIESDGWNGILIEGISPDSLSLVAGEITSESDGYIGLCANAPLISLTGERFDYTGDGAGYNVMGIDADGILHAGRYTAAAVFNSDWRFAISCERVLISGGIPCRDLGGGYSARAAIGQKKDGSIMLLLMQPKGIYPRGATYDELASVMYEYGAVTAAALSPAGDSAFEGDTLLSSRGTPSFTLTFGGMTVGNAAETSEGGTSNE